MSENIVNVVSGHGPFGHYPDRSVGAILNQMVECEYLPLTSVERCTIHNPEDGVYRITGAINGICKWLGGTNRAIFHWDKENYRRSWIKTDLDGLRKPDFRVQLDPEHLQPVLRLTHPVVTETLYDYMQLKVYDERVGCVLQSNVTAIELILTDSPSALEYVKEINEGFVYKDLED